PTHAHICTVCQTCAYGSMCGRIRVCVCVCVKKQKERGYVRVLNRSLQQIESGDRISQNALRRTLNRAPLPASVFGDPDCGSLRPPSRKSMSSYVLHLS